MEIAKLISKVVITVSIVVIVVLCNVNSFNDIKATRKIRNAGESAKLSITTQIVLLLDLIAFSVIMIMWVSWAFS